MRAQRAMRNVALFRFASLDSDNRRRWRQSKYLSNPHKSQAGQASSSPESYVTSQRSLLCFANLKQINHALGRRVPHADDGNAGVVLLLGNQVSSDGCSLRESIENAAASG